METWKSHLFTVILYYWISRVQPIAALFLQFCWNATNIHAVVDSLNLEMNWVQLWPVGAIAQEKWSWEFCAAAVELFATLHSGRTPVSDRWTFPVPSSTCSWRMTTYVGKPSAIENNVASSASLKFLAQLMTVCKFLSFPFAQENIFIIAWRYAVRAMLYARYMLSSYVRPSLCPSVRHTPVLYQPG